MAYNYALMWLNFILFSQNIIFIVGTIFKKLIFECFFINSPKAFEKLEVTLGSNSLLVKSKLHLILFTLVHAHIFTLLRVKLTVLPTLFSWVCIAVVFMKNKKWTYNVNYLFWSSLVGDSMVNVRFGLKENYIFWKVF